MIINRVEQRSETWRKMRLGMPTASRFGDIVTPEGAAVEGEKRKNYLCELVAERVLGEPVDAKFETRWMRRGVELEPHALEAFCKANPGVKVEAGGFVTDDYGRLGCSPDALIVAPGVNHPRAGIEIKVPAPWNHLYYHIYGLGKDYKQQVQGQMFVAELEMMHFFSWNPGLPAYHRMAQRDDVFIAKMSSHLFAFLRDLDAATNLIRAMGPLDSVADVTDALDVPGVAPWRG